MATTIFDYVQVFSWSDGETVPGAGEIPGSELVPDNIIAHIPPDISLAAIDAIITGDEILFVEHIAPLIILSSSPDIEYDGTLIIGNNAPNISISSVPTAGVITSVLSVPPEISISGSASILPMNYVAHAPPSITFASSPDIEHEGVRIIANNPAIMALSGADIRSNLGVAPTWFTGQVIIPPVPTIALSAPSNFIGFHVGFTAPTISIAGVSSDTLLISAELPPATVYKCVLTGTPDLVLPISSFQARIRSGEPTYLEVVVPNLVEYAEDIADRSAGDIVVYKGASVFPDGTINYAEIARADFETLSSDRGGTNFTGRIAGHKTTTYASPKTRSISDVSQVSVQADGKQRVRCGVDFIARPGDTVTWNDGDDSMVVGFITLIVSVLQQIMDITEA